MKLGGATGFWLDGSANGPRRAHRARNELGFLARAVEVSDNAPMHSTRATFLILVALSAACGSDGDSGVKKDGGIADTRINADTTIATDAPADKPNLQPDLPMDTVRVDVPTGGVDLGPVDLARSLDVGAAEVAYTAEVSSEAAVAPSLDAVTDFALPTSDAEATIDLPPLDPGQCRVGADCPDRLKPYCARTGVCVECEWNQQCGSAAPYCVGYRCAPSAEGWLDAGVDVTPDT